jgi:serine/threonine protein kinase
MAPEQALGFGHKVDAQSDVWSVGETLFRMLTGFTVHQWARTLEEAISYAATQHAPRLESILQDSDGAPSDLLGRALAVQKRARWQSARAMQKRNSPAARPCLRLAVSRRASRSTKLAAKAEKSKLA